MHVLLLFLGVSLALSQQTCEWQDESCDLEACLEDVIQPTSEDMEFLQVSSQVSSASDFRPSYSYAVIDPMASLSFEAQETWPFRGQQPELSRILALPQTPLNLDTGSGEAGSGRLPGHSLLQNLALMRSEFVSPEQAPRIQSATILETRTEELLSRELEAARRAESVAEQREWAAEEKLRDMNKSVAASQGRVAILEAQVDAERRLRSSMERGLQDARAAQEASEAALRKLRGEKDAFEKQELRLRSAALMQVETAQSLAQTVVESSSKAVQEARGKEAEARIAAASAQHEADERMAQAAQRVAREVQSARETISNVQATMRDWAPPKS